LTPKVMCSITFSSGNFTPGSRFYSDLVDTCANYLHPQAPRIYLGWHTLASSLGRLIASHGLIMFNRWID